MLLIVGGAAARWRFGERGRALAFALEAITSAGWLTIILFVVEPLVPGNVLGVVILVVLALGVLAVPVVMRHRTRHDDRRHP
ncbi:hypothetical protein CFP71_15165 [Amycolatopsis thailandensis]|uniref:Uncharacterized protein n=1 Tax=Amycolatopsis thailandensis TaxID=589330 RepID=A0A229SBF9_9PSEU|nr:hypothetical protein [Amycolatopsis thailandensis]OXM56155.1 hypothetical protein CFP71_15165 [Amycolatopsis thailandensis]